MVNLQCNNSFKEKGFIMRGCDTIITEKHGAESELSAALR